MSDNISFQTWICPICNDDHLQGQRCGVEQLVSRLMPALNKIKEQEAELEALRSKPCPHIVSGDEGTSYCGLAEANVKRLRAELEATILLYKDALKAYERCNGYNGALKAELEAAREVIRLARTLITYNVLSVYDVPSNASRMTQIGREWNKALKKLDLLKVEAAALSCIPSSKATEQNGVLPVAPVGGNQSSCEPL